MPSLAVCWVIPGMCWVGLPEGGVGESHSKWRSQHQMLLDLVLGADAPGCVLGWA